jgi:hypothetical protein
MQLYQIIVDSTIAFFLLVVTAMIAYYMWRQNKIISQIERPIIAVDWEIKERDGTGYASKATLEWIENPSNTKIKNYEVIVIIQNKGRSAALDVDINFIDNKTGKVIPTSIGDYHFSYRYPVIIPGDKYQLYYAVEFFTDRLS